MSLVGIDKDKYGVKIKYPKRTCKKCNKYPCFQGIDKCKSNFAAYGCVYFAEIKSNSWL